jgi:hypothetical protein
MFTSESSHLSSIADMHIARFLFSLLPVFHHAFAQSHGSGAKGTEMGPVAFMWPADRIWDASYDNTAPCGSAARPSNRSIFPLQQGQVALSIADDAWFVAFRLAVGNGKFASIEDGGD